jgi:DtxR family Mn-dependent transcriptional regulator
MKVQKTGKLSASLEDYLEAIFNLLEGQAVARSKDIAQQLGVTRASVTGALRNLAQKGLIHYKPYGFITLTEKGGRLAARVARRHQVLHSFFADILGLEEGMSQEAACRAEHTLGSEIINRLTVFIDFLNRQDTDGNDLAAEFESFRLQNSEENKNSGGKFMPD